MRDDRTPAAIAHSIVTTLADCTRRRDLTGVLDLFVDDAALFGSDAGGFARGRADLQDLSGPRSRHGSIPSTTSRSDTS